MQVYYILIMISSRLFDLMTKLFPIIIFLLVSCTSKQQVKETIPNKQSAVLLKSDTIDYSYIWLNQAYFKGLNQGMSHAELFDTGEISYFGMAPDNKSLIVVSKFYSGNRYTQSSVGQSLTFQGMDTLKIVQLQPNLVKINNDTLFKSKIQDPNYILESILFSGTYQNLGSRELVKIDSLGRIKGIKEFNQINVEYTQANETSYNFVTFTGTNRGKQFIYEFENDTLKLYDQDCIYINESFCLTQENLLLTLIKTLTKNR